MFGCTLSKSSSSMECEINLTQWRKAVFWARVTSGGIYMTALEEYFFSSLGLAMRRTRVQSPVKKKRFMSPLPVITII